MQRKHFLLNGETYAVDQDIRLSLFDILLYFDYQDSLLVLEHNNLICEKNSWKTTFIQHLDKIEIVSIVGGG